MVNKMFIGVQIVRITILNTLLSYLKKVQIMVQGIKMGRITARDNRRS